MNATVKFPCEICQNISDDDVAWDAIPANCDICHRYICDEHGGVDEYGGVFCEDCAKRHNVILVP